MKLRHTQSTYTFKIKKKKKAPEKLHFSFARVQLIEEVP